MSLQAFRFAIVASTLLVTAAVALAFLGAPEIGSAFVMITASAGSELPVLTSSVSLPLLRIGPGDPHERPVTKAWVGFVWLSLFAFPVAAAVWACRASTLEAAAARWVAGHGVYIPYVSVVMLVILVGLAAPMACL